MIIFILTTISALIVWNTFPRENRFAVIVGLFLVNAVLNLGWSHIFFGVHALGWSVVEAALLELSVLALIFLIWPLSRWTAVLIFPYAAWVMFATYLTYSVWSLN
jgi:tryptophan-rich sensory protein